jgi:hypothetical protein
MAASGPKVGSNALAQRRSTGAPKGIYSSAAPAPVVNDARVDASTVAVSVDGTKRAKEYAVTHDHAAAV